MRTITVSVAVMLCVFASSGLAQQAQMSFFVTSVGLGKGADLGGLEGADRHCQSLAATAGAGSKTWRAYLSTQGANAINAKDRIGNGPWSNAKGVQIAANVADLHATTTRSTRRPPSTRRARRQRPRRHAQPA